MVATARTTTQSLLPLRNEWWSYLHRMAIVCSEFEGLGTLKLLGCQLFLDEPGRGDLFVRVELDRAVGARAQLVVEIELEHSVS